MYAKLDATRHEDFLEAFSFSRTGGPGRQAPDERGQSTGYGSNGALLYGTYNGVDIRAESRYDVLSTTFTQPTLTFEHEVNEWVKLNGPSSAAPIRSSAIPCRPRRRSMRST
jgi:iron complex outermembrane receptor protein